MLLFWQNFLLEMLFYCPINFFPSPIANCCCKLVHFLLYSFYCKDWSKTVIKKFDLLTTALLKPNSNVWSYFHITLTPPHKCYQYAKKKKRQNLHLRRDDMQVWIGRSHWSQFVSWGNVLWLASSPCQWIGCASCKVDWRGNSPFPGW